MSEATRIVLVGTTGVGKSALGNTLLGTRTFESHVAGESVTNECQVRSATINGRRVQIVDTPGVLDTTRSKDVNNNKVENAMKALHPGPHAILIVVSPLRFTGEETQILKELVKLFHDDSCLHFTVLVMVRRNEILTRGGALMDIKEFMNSKGVPPALQELYKQCGNRIVAVDNFAPKTERDEYAKDVFDAIDNIGGGYFNYAYIEINRLKKELEKSTCDIS